MAFYYKGVNISSIFQGGPSTVPTNTFVGFPSFLTSNYNSTDRAYPISYSTNATNYEDISNQYTVVATYQDFTSTTNGTFPSWANNVHIVAIGGGGGKGGNGGCGYDGFTTRHNGGAGAPGAAGQYVAFTDNNSLPINGGNFSVVVGGAGNNGNGGSTHPTGNAGSGGAGNDGGQGGSSYVNFYTANGAPETIGAAGGGGGGAGNGGNANNSDSPTNSNVTVNGYSNNAPVEAVNTGNGNMNQSPLITTAPSNYNPVGYINSYGKNQTQGTVRIYFLKS